MRIANEMRIAHPPDDVLAALLDVRRVAGCLPGGRLTGRSGDAHTGEVTVRVGTLRAAYTGTVRYLEADRARRRIVVRARGTEASGQGDADVHVVVTVGPDGGGSVVSLDTHLTVRGRVARFGRSALTELADRATARFAAAMERRLAEAEPAHAGPAPDGPRRHARPALGRAAAPAAVAALVAAGVAAGVVLRRRSRR